MTPTLEMVPYEAMFGLHHSNEVRGHNVRRMQSGCIQNDCSPGKFQEKMMSSIHQSELLYRLRQIVEDRYSFNGSQEFWLKTQMAECVF